MVADCTEKKRFGAEKVAITNDLRRLSKGM
jgi:hypothetical protein